MTVEELVDIVSGTIEGKAIGGADPKAFWSDIMSNVLRPVLNKIATTYDWDFTMADYSSVTTVANQAEYTITGSNYDLRDIVSIRYGSDKNLLNLRRYSEADSSLSDGNTIGQISSWYQFKTNDQGYPIITIYDTPATAGVALYIRYRMKDVNLERFPDSFDWVIVDGVMGRLSQNKMNQFNRSLKQMVKNYRDGGADTSVVGFDSHIGLTNARNASINRVG